MFTWVPFMLSFKTLIALLYDRRSNQTKDWSIITAHHTVNGILALLFLFLGFFLFLLSFCLLSFMALWFISRTSRNISNHLIKRNVVVGLLGILRNISPSSSLLLINHHCDDHGISRNPPDHPSSASSLFNYFTRRFESTMAHTQPHSGNNDDENQALLDFPGGRVTFTSQMRFIADSPEKRTHCYKVLNDKGQAIIGSNYEQISKEVAVRMYKDMVTLQVMDTIFYEAQRQGRISFYLTTAGEEAINIGSAAALTLDDIIFPQYREPGVLLWRGFTLQEFANQLFSNKDDYGKGRQMPIHYGSNKLNYVTVSSPIATQIPQAVGAAYSLRMENKDACAVTYFGDGSTSEGDFHAALNFAAVMEAPVIFICRNNGWAISTPTSQQFRSDGIVVKGQAYGISSIRVDGNDTLAVYSAVHAAREMAISQHRPILIEALTYRVGHHSTSDDSTKYRPVNEIEHWRMARDPVSRFRKWVQMNDWWSDEEESQLRIDVRKKVLNAIQVAESVKKPALTDLFTDVYASLPSNLREQEKLLRDTVMKHRQDYPLDVPL